MGCYICLECDGMFDSHDVPCYESKEQKHRLICESCYIERYQTELDAQAVRREE